MISRFGFEAEGDRSKGLFFEGNNVISSIIRSIGKRKWKNQDGSQLKEWNMIVHFAWIPCLCSNIFTIFDSIDCPSVLRRSFDRGYLGIEVWFGPIAPPGFHFYWQLTLIKGQISNLFGGIIRLTIFSRWISCHFAFIAKKRHFEMITFEKSKFTGKCTLLIYQ